MTHARYLHAVPNAPEKPKRTKPPRDYRAVLKARGFKPMVVERTEKRAGEFEFDHRGQLVEVRGDG